MYAKNFVITQTTHTQYMMPKRSIAPKKKSVLSSLSSNASKLSKTSKKRVNHTGVKYIKAAILLYPDCPCKNLLHEIVNAVKEEDVNEPYTEKHARTDLSAIFCTHNS